MVVNLDQLELIKDAEIPIYTSARENEEPYTNQINADELVEKLRKGQQKLLERSGI